METCTIIPGQTLLGFLFAFLLAVITSYKEKILASTAALRSDIKET
jgi:hypothetical protein